MKSVCQQHDNSSACLGNCYVSPCADKQGLLLLHRHPPARRLRHRRSRTARTLACLEGLPQAASGSAALRDSLVGLLCTSVTPAHQGVTKGPPFLLKALHSSLAVDSLHTAAQTCRLRSPCSCTGQSCSQLQPQGPVHEQRRLHAHG